MAAKRTYSDRDLAEISAIGIGPAREWIEQCERAAVEEQWRDSFSPTESVEDSSMAEWAMDFLPRVGLISQSRVVPRVDPTWRRSEIIP
jgi:hypothetical protein